MTDIQNQSTKPNVLAAIDKKVADNNAAEKLKGQEQMEAKASAPAQQGASVQPSQQQGASVQTAQQGDSAVAKA